MHSAGPPDRIEELGRHRVVLGPVGPAIFLAGIAPGDLGAGNFIY
ncbi:hypothetical protein [Acuticoccus sp. I52.16.1]|nr:hypothetical protein [Acuticoccus sp. I52.16.1]